MTVASRTWRLWQIIAVADTLIFTTMTGIAVTTSQIGFVEPTVLGASCAAVALTTKARRHAVDRESTQEEHRMVRVRALEDHEEYMNGDIAISPQIDRQTRLLEVFYGARDVDKDWVRRARHALTHPDDWPAETVDGLIEEVTVPRPPADLPTKAEKARVRAEMKALDANVAWVIGSKKPVQQHDSDDEYRVEPAQPNAIRAWIAPDWWIPPTPPPGTVILPTSRIEYLHQVEWSMFRLPK